MNERNVERHDIERLVALEVKLDTLLAQVQHLAKDVVELKNMTRPSWKQVVALVTAGATIVGVITAGTL